MISKNLFNILILFFCLTNFTLGTEIIIKAKIDNEIITNIDIENEKKYLFFLNPKLKELNNKDSDIISKNSLIKEIIKTKELKKIFNIDKEYNFVDKIEKNLLKQKKINNKNEFIQYLNINNLNYLQIRQKLKIEGLWNQLVYKKYFKNVRINN